MSSKTQKKNGIQPKLRFPEFRDVGDWDQKSIGDKNFATLHKGKGIAKLDIVPDGKTPCIRYGELYTYYGEIIDSVISYTNCSESELFLSKKNDVIIPSSGETKIDIATASCVRLDNVALGSDLNVIRTQHNGVFLSYYLNGALKHDIAKVAQGDSVVHLYPSQLEKICLLVPKPKEQQKIADCLSSLDELIEAEDQKLNVLQQHKKGLMQKLFPAKGETLPKRRFPEFQSAPEWEEKKLGQIGDVLMCKRIFAEETNDKNGIPFFKIGTLGGKPDAFISKELFEDYKSRYNYPRKGEILITCSGTVGKCLPYDGNDAYYQDSNIVWIDNPTLEVSNEFLLNLLSNKDWGRLNSTTITRIYGSDLRDMPGVFPSDKKEQKRIADFLSSIDNLITAQSQKVDALRDHKKGLMQQLFPAANEVEK